MSNLLVCQKNIKMLMLPPVQFIQDQKQVEVINLKVNISTIYYAENFVKNSIIRKINSKYYFAGSIDLSPSCSESQPTTPNYLKWAESMQYLLDDGDGCSLFQTYLNQQSLGHLLEFV